MQTLHIRSVYDLRTVVCEKARFCQQLASSASSYLPSVVRVEDMAD